MTDFSVGVVKAPAAFGVAPFVLRGLEKVLLKPERILLLVIRSRLEQQEHGVYLKPSVVEPKTLSDYSEICTVVYSSLFHQSKSIMLTNRKNKTFLFQNHISESIQNLCLTTNHSNKGQAV